MEINVLRNSLKNLDGSKDIFILINGKYYNFTTAFYAKDEDAGINDAEFYFICVSSPPKNFNPDE